MPVIFLPTHVLCPWNIGATLECVKRVQDVALPAITPMMPIRRPGRKMRISGAAARRCRRTYAAGSSLHQETMYISRIPLGRKIYKMMPAPSWVKYTNHLLQEQGSGTRTWPTAWVMDEWQNDRTNEETPEGQQCMGVECLSSPRSYRPTASSNNGDLQVGRQSIFQPHVGTQPAMTELLYIHIRGASPTPGNAQI